MPKRSNCQAAAAAAAAAAGGDKHVLR